jgi:orotidine-5'-phosphate decarboxylase
MAILKRAGYPVELARINSSSALTHPWKNKGVPEDWLELCITNLHALLEETSL